LLIGEDYSIFETEPFANDWRQSTFQSVARVCDGSTSSHYLADIARENGEKTGASIKEFLNDILTATGNPGSSAVPQSVAPEIEQIVSLAAEIALQFGIHQSHLILMVPEHGETIIIGEDYYHVQDADSEKGTAKVVDLVTLPGFAKYGTKKSKSAMNVYVPCEIYYPL
jgi:hypothetical protein